METTIVYRGYFGIVENKTETTIVYWGKYWGLLRGQGARFSVKQV